jgi:trans-2-enoyl-CoA reductase
MRAAQYTSHGNPEDVISVVDLENPRPGPGEVLVDVEAAPIHLADLYCMQGKERFQVSLPAIPGFEGVGRVSDIGEGVTNHAIGDRVFIAMGRPSWMEQVVLPAAELLPAPAGDATQLALLPINAPTSYLIIKDFDIQPGDWLIQNAANSNCGRYIIEIARSLGIHTVNVVRRAELITELEALGGDVVLLDGDDLAQRVQAATGGAEIGLGVDAVNGMATARLAECLAEGGTILAYGMLTGEPCMVPPAMMWFRKLTLKGFYTAYQFADRTPEQVRQVYAEINQLFETGILRARIAASYPLEDVKTAVAHAGRRGAEREGKVILTMAS